MFNNTALIKENARLRKDLAITQSALEEMELKYKETEAALRMLNKKCAKVLEAMNALGGDKAKPLQSCP